MATRFWVGGTGTWDAVTTTHWAATTGGAGGASVPGSADTVTFDGASGGGTVTVNFGGTISVQSITCGAFTGTLDFSANNNSVTLSVSFSGTGSGTRTINLGNGTWTLTSLSSIWNFGTTTGLTFNANSSTINMSGAVTSASTFSGGALAYNALTLGANGVGGSRTIAGANTFATLTVTGQNMLTLQANQTVTTLNLNGTSSGQVGVQSSVVGTARTITVTTLSAAWAAIRDIAFSGAGLSATSSFDLGNNSGATITAPSAGGGLAANPVGGFIG